MESVDLEKFEEFNIKDIQNEMKSFYGLNVSNQDVMDWLEMYHFDRLEEDEDYSGNFEFDTSEREDFYHYISKE